MGMISVPRVVKILYHATHPNMLRFLPRILTLSVSLENMVKNFDIC
jgi:hypothetical protein